MRAGATFIAFVGIIIAVIGGLGSFIVLGAGKGVAYVGLPMVFAGVALGILAAFLMAIAQIRDALQEMQGDVKLIRVLLEKRK